jgi:hypothetical protein
MVNWTKVSVKDLLSLIWDKSTKDCLDKRQKAFSPRSILHMHSRRPACLNDFPRDLQVSFLSEPSPDEDVIDVSLRKPGPHIFHTFPYKHLQIGARELLLRVGEDTVRDSQEEDLFAHVSSPFRIVVRAVGLSLLQLHPSPKPS